VIACFAAFFVTQRLKHTPTAVQRFELSPSFSPTSAGPSDQEHVSFKLAQADRATVTIINANGDVVATLLSDHPVARYKQFSLRWNGRSGTAQRFTTFYTARGTPVLVAGNHGRLVPAGEYRAQVSLREQHRTVTSPRTFVLVGR
jgi:hypothetical protein